MVQRDFCNTSDAFALPPNGSERFLDIGQILLLECLCQVLGYTLVGTVLWLGGGAIALYQRTIMRDGVGREGVIASACVLHNRELDTLPLHPHQSSA